MQAERTIETAVDRQTAQNIYRNDLGTSLAIYLE